MIYYKILLDFLKRGQFETPLVDFLIIGEGEKALEEIIRGRKNSFVPNLIYWHNQKFHFSENFCYVENFKKLPAPIYDSFEIPKVQVSRSCYYNRCIYCAYKNFPRNYSAKDSNQICKEVIQLKENYRGNIKDATFYFADSALSPRFIKEFSEKMVGEDFGYNFCTYVRMEKGLNKEVLKKAKEAGFGKEKIGLWFGLETSNRRLNRMINKGIDLGFAQEIIDNCGKMNISIAINFILNLPTQTKKEFLEELKYIKRLLDLYENIIAVINLFYLANFEYFYKNREKYKIKALRNNNDFKFFLPYKHEGQN